MRVDLHNPRYGFEVKLKMDARVANNPPTVYEYRFHLLVLERKIGEPGERRCRQNKCLAQLPESADSYGLRAAATTYLFRQNAL